jgi:hypothetical protein
MTDKYDWLGAEGKSTENGFDIVGEVGDRVNGFSGSRGCAPAAKVEGDCGVVGREHRDYA